MFVVVWEPKHGAGGGHQAVMDPDQAERIGAALRRSKSPDIVVRVMTAEEHSASAVAEREQLRQQHYRRPSRY